MIKDLIKSRVSLAPMAGITDYVLRSLVRENSVSALLTTEMISSEFLTQCIGKDIISRGCNQTFSENKKGGDIIERAENHSPISYQLSGHKPKMIANCAKYLEQYADMIDINMGCPVNKVVKGTDGCALMRNVDLAQEIVREVKSNIHLPLSVKFRLGYTFDDLNFVEFGEKMQEAGADFITVHGRTRSQMYGGKADWKMISKLKHNVDIPVFANGDVVSIETAVQCLEESEADGVAVGRGTLGDVTLIGRIEKYLNQGIYLPPPTIEEKVEILKEHINREVELRGEQVGIKFCRKFYPYYLNGFQGASRLRGEIVLIDKLSDVLKTINSVLLQK